MPEKPQTSPTAGLFLAVTVIGVGALWSVLRFGGLQTRASRDAIIISYGLVSTRQRVIPWQAVVGVELRRNPLELLLGRVRLSIISADSDTRLGSNLVLPSIRNAAAVDIIRASPLLTTLTDNPEPATGRLRALGTAAVTFIGTVVVAGGAAVLAVRTADARPIVGIATLVLVYAALRVAGGTATTSARFVGDGETLAITSMFITQRHVGLDVASVHILTTLTLRRTSVLARFHYYAGRPRALSAAHFNEREVRSLALALGQRPTKENVTT